MSNDTVARTFIAIPETRLPTVIRADLSQRRIEETVLVAPAAAMPTGGSAWGDHTRIVGAGPPRSPPYPDLGDRTILIDSRQDAAARPRAERRQSVSRPPLPPGFQVARYRIEEPIGEGGFAIAYKAVDTNLDRRIVIKELFLPEHCERDETQAIRAFGDRDSERAFRWASYYFSQEARITADMRHDGIVRLTDFFKTNGTAYIGYEMLEGTDLSQHAIARRHGYSHAEALHLLRASAEALLYVHERGVLHRDVKPSNIYMERRSGRPILIDFGAAIETTARRSDNFLAVSDGFSPPELYRPEALHDARTDIYALCATMYWVLSGSRPPSAPDRVAGTPTPPVRAVLSSDFRIGERLSRVIETGMQLEPERRYRDVASLIDDLLPRVSLPASGYQGEPRGDKIFLSYRREDSTHFSGRLLDFLEMRFGTGSTFFDVESIPAGIDFWDHIKSTLQRCAVLVVVIGPGWLASLEKRRRRWWHIGRHGDFVEAEIRAALEMRLPILPVLFDGAAMPAERALPKALRPLTGLNAAIIGSGKAFRQGADGVCDQIASIRASLARRGALLPPQ